jgi:hypothetical protein
VKKIIVIVIAVGLLGGLGLWGIMGRGKKDLSTAKTTPTPKKEVKMVEMALADRPFVSLTPVNSGRELELAITRIKNLTKIEYELTYLTNGLSRGAVGSISLNSEDKITRKLTLGSCSRNVCNYDENVTQGSLSLRLVAADGVTRLTSDFHLQKGSSGELSSLDGQFKLTGKLERNTYYVTMGTMGLPGEFASETVGEPHGVFTTASTVIKGAKINLTGVYGWIGGQWQKLDSNNISVLTTYVVGK